MAKNRKKFSEYSKPMQALMIFGVLFWAMVFSGTMSSNEPKTPEQIAQEARKAETQSMIADIRAHCDAEVKRNLKVRKGAKIPLFDGRIDPMTNGVLQYKNTVTAQNTFGAHLTEQFACDATYMDGKVNVLRVKIGTS